MGSWWEVSCLFTPHRLWDWESHDLPVFHHTTSIQVHSPLPSLTHRPLLPSPLHQLLLQLGLVLHQHGKDLHLTGFLLLQRSGLDAGERANVLAAIRGEFSVTSVERALKEQWADDDLLKRDKSHYQAHFAQRTWKTA